MKTVSVIASGQTATLKAFPGVKITIGGAIVPQSGEPQYNATVIASEIGGLKADQFTIDTEESESNGDPQAEESDPNA